MYSEDKNKDISQIIPKLETPFIGKPVITNCLGKRAGYICSINNSIYCKYNVKWFESNVHVNIR